jgi:hypothetical protein
MCCGIDEPGGVEIEAVSELSCKEPCCQEVLSPEEHGKGRREEEAAEEDEWEVVLFLEGDDRVSGEVREVETLALLNESRVLPAEEPAHVSKEKPTLGIMRIGMGLGVLVMNTVVPAPLPNAVLEGNGLEEGEEDSEGEAGFVRLVRPEPVTTRRHAHG